MGRVLVAVLLVACTRAAPTSSAVTSTGTSTSTSTNIARADYVGPAACGECHAEQYASWSRSLHRVMNARADDRGAVIGNFDGAVVAYRGGEARFSREGGAYVMTLARGERRVTYRVTRTIGRRGLQEYVGVAGGDEVRLPFGWWPRGGGWQPQPAFDPWLDEASFDPFVEVKEPWAERCPWCHSTYPFAQRIARASGPRPVGHGLEQWFATSPGGARLAVDQQVTVGISCESCHLGGRIHADGGAISFVPSGATRRPDAPVMPASFAAQRRDADVVDAVCAQCHSGPSPRLADGTATRNSSEAIDLANSPCTGIKCTDCHDPHRGGFDEARSVAACQRCHPAIDASHSAHHTASCLDCHMPKLVMGLDRFVRTHRISSPSDAAQLADGAANACNLCHLDRSIAWTAGELRAIWDARVRGDASDEPAGEAWLHSKQPWQRLVATHAYARSPLAAGMRDELARGLADPLAYVRAWTALALQRPQ